MFLTDLFLRRSTQAELDAFYPIRPECKDSVPKARFKLRAGKTLSARRWHASFNEDGHLDIAKVLKRIQRGGVHPSVRGAVWELLLGCYDPNSTVDDRSLIRQRRREQYDEYKKECRKMVPVIGSGKFITTPIITEDGQPIEDVDGAIGVRGSNQEDQDDPILQKKVIQWMQVLPQIAFLTKHLERKKIEELVLEMGDSSYDLCSELLLKHIAGLDVVRTDQALIFYENESNQAKLWNILSIYAWRDSDISYVQGMNDICSPMVILLEDEADAFWCFDRAMRRLRDNFKTSATSMGVQARLSTLSGIIKVVDPKLHQHLEELDGGEYLFAFRMLMVLFRREFCFVDALYLWELMWAMEYNPNTFLLYETCAADSTVSDLNNKILRKYGKFERENVKTGCKDYQCALAVFLAASIIENRHKRILQEAKGLDDVLEILGDVTKSIDAKKVCKDALVIQKKFLKKAQQPS